MEGLTRQGGLDVATRDDILQGLERVRERFADPSLGERFKDFTRTLLFTCPDVELSFVVELVQGRVASIREGTTEKPDIHVTVYSGTFVDMVNGRMNPLRAHALGKVKASGPIADLMRLQKLA